MLADDAVTDAAFKGSVTFDDEGLNARAADIRYQPRSNKIALSGADAGGSPHVSVDQISIDARAIDVALEDRQINATDVKTTLSPQKGGEAGWQAPSGGIAIPGLLRQDEEAQINADELEYRGAAGQAVYRGKATLWQGKTTIRGDVVSLDQEKGSLVATGSAKSTLELDTGASIGTGRRDPLRRREAGCDLQCCPASTDKRKGIRLCRRQERGSGRRPPCSPGPGCAIGWLSGRPACRANRDRAREAGEQGRTLGGIHEGDAEAGHADGRRCTADVLRER
jgi:hypothetical protein